MLKRLISAIAFACLFVSPVSAQSNKTAQISQIASCFSDTAAIGGITPAIVRTCLDSMVNSYQQFAGVNAQVGTSYAIAANDYGQLVTFNNASPVAVSLSQAIGSFFPFSTYVKNLGAGLVTFTPTTSTINGAATFTLAQNQSAFIISDGINYQVWNSATVPNSFGVQAANTHFAGPTSGPAANPSFRALVGADLPLPTTSSLGGLESITCASHSWINTIPTTLVQPTCLQPGYSDLSGTVPAVTSVTPGGGLVSSTSAACSQTAITVTGTLSESGCLDARTTTTEAINDSDRGQLITASNSAAQAYSLAQAGAASQFVAGWCTSLKNKSTAAAGVVTITPTTSTIDGGSSLKVYPGQGLRICSDGTNYQVAWQSNSQQAWQLYTASPACAAGSGTWVTNSAHYQQNGKTVFWQLDVSISVINTCTGSRFTFSLPTTPNSGAGGAGFEGNIGNGAISCGNSPNPTSATMNCSDSVALAVNDRFTISGVYESQ